MYDRKISRLPSLSVEEIKKIIQREEIKTVSFDLFDTLLMRPCKNQRSVFYLLQEYVKRTYDLDFVALRYHAEETLGKENATLEEIWSDIARRNSLSPIIASELELLEIQLETDILIVRKEMQQIYEYAIALGKRVIVISDMYLSSEVLLNILRKKGFSEIDKVYVSCECGKRKSTGALFRHVLEKEGICDMSKLLHIGDNEQSDFAIPLNQGITAIHYPCLWDLIFQNNTQWMYKNLHSLNDNPYLEIIMGFSFVNAHNSGDRLVAEERMFPTIQEYADLLLAPMVTSIGLQIYNNPKIQERYSKILFAARDGYLPKKIYDILAKESDARPSDYLYASRQALSFTGFKSFFDYFTKSNWFGKKYSLEDFVRIYVTDKQLCERILAEIEVNKKPLNLCDNVVGCCLMLLRFRKELERYFDDQKRYSQEYYSEKLSDQDARAVVFDCGYSGSVSTGLMKACGKKVDKIYIWETETNRALDKENDTITYCLSAEKVSLFNLVIEECFSPMEGSCVGFRKECNKIIPVCGNQEWPYEMKKTMDKIEKSCCSFAEVFREKFKAYLGSFQIDELASFMKIFQQAFIDSPYNEIDLFEPIQFVDSHMAGVPLCLSRKLTNIFEEQSVFSSQFSGTGFANPYRVVNVPKNRVEINSRLGIHIHMYNKHLVQEFIGYLKDMPYQFDLYITTGEESFAQILSILFNRYILPNLQKLTVIVTPNRGRDVAPWLIECKDIQKQYDFFCHVHAKVSKQYGEGVGDNWRHYLLDNLLARDAVLDIMAILTADETIGVIFPSCYSVIKEIHEKSNIPLYGEFGEKEMIECFLKKMGFTGEMSRSDLLCSMGTMMWYRPKAIQPLFEIGLQYDDFPEEPIPVGGTIAHAIERIFTVVARNQKYKSVQFNEYEENVDICKQDTITEQMKPTIELPFDTNDAYNQFAIQMGMRETLRLYYCAVRIFLAKKKMLWAMRIPVEKEKREIYNKALELGIRDSLTVLKKTIGMYIFKN